MNHIIRNVTVLNDGYKEPIDYVCGTNAIPIVFNVTDYDIPAGSTATAVCIKPSGMGTSATAQISGNSITIPVTTQTFMELGKSELQVEITNGDSVLVTFSWPVMVKPNYADGDLPASQNESTFFQQLAAAAQQAIDAANDVQTAIDAANEAVENVNTSLQAIDTAIPNTLFNDDVVSGTTGYTSQKIQSLLAGYISGSELDNYVQKQDGYGLSQNDFTDADAQKLEGIAENANDYVHPTTPGWIHLPTGGAAGQVVGWSSDGAGQWVSPQNLYLINVPTSTLTANCSYNDGIVTSMFTVDVPTILGLSASADYRQVVAVLQYMLNFGIASQYNQIQVILDTNGITDAGGGVSFGYQIDAKLVPSGDIEISLQVGSYNDTDCSNFKENVGNMLILVAVQSNLDQKTAS